jgi:hypothetical protein
LKPALQAALHSTLRNKVVLHSTPRHSLVVLHSTLRNKAVLHSTPPNKVALRGRD